MAWHPTGETIQMRVEKNPFYNSTIESPSVNVGAFAAKYGVQNPENIRYASITMKSTVKTTTMAPCPEINWYPDSTSKPTFLEVFIEGIDWGMNESETQKQDIDPPQSPTNNNNPSVKGRTNSSGGGGCISAIWGRFSRAEEFAGESSSWTLAVPLDGAFDSPYEEFEYTVPEDLLDGEYIVEIKSLNEAGEKDAVYSSCKFTVETGAPAVPKNLASVFVLENNVISLSWTPNKEGDLAGYKLYRSGGNGYNLIVALSPEATYYIDDTVSGDNIGCYTYRLTAYDNLGNESEYSNEATVYIPCIDYVAPVTVLHIAGEHYERPEDSTAFVTTNTSFTLTATDDNSGIKLTRYRIDSGSWTEYGGVAFRLVRDEEVGRLPDGCAGYWRYEEGVGEILEDSSGKGHSGGFLGGVRAPQWTDGKIGGGLIFTDRARVVIPHSAEFNFEDGMSVEYWAKVNELSDSVFGGVSKLSGGYPVEGWRLIGLWPSYWSYPGWARGYFYQTRKNDDNIIVNSAVEPEVGKWHHVAATFDRARGSIRIYIDGQMNKEETRTTPPGVNELPIEIGAFGVAPIYLDEVAIYNRALSDEEIKERARVYYSTITLCDGPHQLFYQSIDNVGNIEEIKIANVVIDNITPGRITDITAVSGPGAGEITLSWTAPGDNSYTGEIKSGKYKVVYDSQLPVTSFEVMWSTNTVPGVKEMKVLTGLSSATTYWIYILCEDKVKNVSEESNMVCARTYEVVESTDAHVGLLVYGAARYNGEVVEVYVNIIDTGTPAG